MAYSGYDAVAGLIILIIIIVTHLVVISLVINSANACNSNGDFNDQWYSAHATAHGGANDSHTIGKDCGNDKGIKEWDGRGKSTAAVSSTLFNNGSSCGQCYEIKCVGGPGLPQWCKPGSPSVTVMATGLCRPNKAAPPSGGGWCNPPREHFALAQSAWLQIAIFEAGIVPVEYRRVQCK